MIKFSTTKFFSLSPEVKCYTCNNRVGDFPVMLTFWFDPPKQGQDGDWLYVCSEECATMTMLQYV